MIIDNNIIIISFISLAPHRTKKHRRKSKLIQHIPILTKLEINANNNLLLLKL